MTGGRKAQWGWRGRAWASLRD